MPLEEGTQEVMEWSFEADKPAVAMRVRKEMVAHLARRVPPDVDLGDAEAIIGELLSNAVLHGGGRIRAIIRSAPSDAFVTVCDEGPTFVLTRPRSLGKANSALDEHGRGMHIITAFSRDARVHRLGAQKAVTVQLQLQ